MAGLFEIENWWKHNGCYDREQASGIPYDGKDASDYLEKTDGWWDSLSPEERRNVYREFFEET